MATILHNKDTNAVFRTASLIIIRWNWQTMMHLARFPDYTKINANSETGPPVWAVVRGSILGKY